MPATGPSSRYAKVSRLPRRRRGRRTAVQLPLSGWARPRVCVCVCALIVCVSVRVRLFQQHHLLSLIFLTMFQFDVFGFILRPLPVSLCRGGVAQGAGLSQGVNLCVRSPAALETTTCPR